MRTPHRTIKQRNNELGLLLRRWRDLRGLSQLDLANDADVSQRHISFLESGRSIPSRPTLLGIIKALDIPLRDRNIVLQASGYAPIYPNTAWNAPEMHTVTDAFQRVLRHNEPFPAVVLDRYWNVLLSNDSAPKFFNHFIDLDARPTPRNFLHLLFDPAGMRPFITNWDEVSKCLLERVYREAVGRVIDDKTRQLLTTLHAYPGADTEEPKNAGPHDAHPIIPIGFAKDGLVLNYFSMVTVIGTPQMIAAQEMRVDCLVPADEATEKQHAAMMDRK